MTRAGPPLCTPIPSSHWIPEALLLVLPSSLLPTYPRFRGTSGALLRFRRHLPLHLSPLVLAPRHR